MHWMSLFELMHGAGVLHGVLHSSNAQYISSCCDVFAMHGLTETEGEGMMIKRQTRM